MKLFLCDVLLLIKPFIYLNNRSLKEIALHCEKVMSVRYMLEQINVQNRMEQCGLIIAIIKFLLQNE